MDEHLHTAKGGVLPRNSFIQAAGTGGEGPAASAPQISEADMPEASITEFLAPPSSPAECIFAQTMRTISADLKSQVLPCQFGGKPDCSQCGCMASMGLAAIGHHKVGMGLTGGRLFKASLGISRLIKSLERSA